MKVFDKGSNVFKILSEAVSEGIIIVNDSHQIVASNAAANIIFGYKKEELNGLALDDIIPRESKKKHTKFVTDYNISPKKRQIGQARNIKGLCKDGKIIPLEVGLNPFKIYDNQYVMALVVDITEQLSYTKNLENKIAQRTKQLQEALANEKELSELKTKFLSLVSHEFKTPLSSILTSATLAGKYTKEEQQDQREKHLSIIQSKVKYLNAIINDFLSIERLDSGKEHYKYTNFPISKVINEVLYDVKTHLKEGQHINFPDSIDNIYIDFDEKILVLILTNVLHNAIKYSPENASIDLGITKFKKTLRITVADCGMGIPKKDQKYIFNRYFRAENAVLIQGTGIGLNIVKTHLENLGGSIQFTSAPGKETEFVITIPLFHT